MKILFLLILGFGSMGSVASSSDKVENLESIIFSNQNKACVDYISNLKDTLGYEIPSYVCAILENNKLINESYSSIFLGFEALSLDDLKANYSSPSSELSFFSEYNINQNFEVEPDYSIVIEELKESDGKNAELLNFKRLLPLFKFQGDYLLLDLHPKYYGRLLVTAHTHIANVLAPSMKDHLDDLKDGLKKKIYFKNNEEEIIYPVVWEDRIAVKTGKADIDEYGDISYK